MDAVSWSVAAPVIGAAFTASLVEVVEAFTIVLAVVTIRGWRPAVSGTIAALALLHTLSNDQRYFLLEFFTDRFCSFFLTSAFSCCSCSPSRASQS